MRRAATDFALQAQGQSGSRSRRSTTDEPDVSRFGDRLERARRPRAQAQYGRRAIGTPPQPMTAADVTALLADFLAVAHGWLARQRPSITWPNPPAAPPAPSASQP